MIQLRSVTKSYPPDQTALNSMDLLVQPGEFVFIAGASGAGKSTLLRLLYGAEKATTGSVMIAGRDLSQLDQSGISEVRREIGIVFQDYKLLARRSVIDNVAFGLEVQGYAVRERRLLAYKMLKTVGLADKADQSPLTLSGGEQQRVAVARALIHQPRIILADEPTGNLDREMTWVIFDLIKEANLAGTTVLVATHDLAIIEELGYRTIVLDKGKVIGNFDVLRRVE